MATTFPNRVADYAAVRRSIQDGRPMTARSELGRSFQALAKHLSGYRPPERSSKVGALLNSWISRPGRAAARV